MSEAGRRRRPLEVNRSRVVDCSRFRYVGRRVRELRRLALGFFLTPLRRPSDAGRAEEPRRIPWARRIPTAASRSITGASTGIGFELARCAAAEGYDLVIAADEPENP